MCCFSGPVKYVSGTRIFARSVDAVRQAIVYQMTLAADEPLAMVLPIPVPIGTSDDAVRFVSLERYRGFFDDLANGFPPAFAPQARASAMLFGGATPKPLVVHAVGAFDASFVPRLADFERLDPRFRLADGVFDALPAYRDFGFAVFQLRIAERGVLGRLFSSAQPQTIHPMAFVFPRRDPSSLFFPSVHVHDGEVHPRARFDHTLYVQCDGPLPPTWETSSGPASSFVVGPRTEGLVDLPSRVSRCFLVGELPNEDVIVSELAPRAA